MTKMLCLRLLTVLNAAAAGTPPPRASAAVPLMSATITFVEAQHQLSVLRIPSEVGLPSMETHHEVGANGRPLQLPSGWPPC